ncbi:MAG: YgjV family protein [Clostridia bacterium]|nr:YgjV family protein [Clostridia bacterium]
MKILPQIIGLLAVATFLFSYQLKKRSNIILLNTISRCLYILQYLLLGAFSGAVFDILAAISSVFAGKKHMPFIKKNIKTIVITINFCVLVTGIIIAFSNRSILDLFALTGVLLEINALWPTDEKAIRLISLLAAPFWFTYNFLSCAYGSSLGNVFTIVSIAIAMIRYKNLKPNTNIE